MSTFDDASLVLIPSGYKASKVYSVKPTDGTGDLTFTRALDTATRVAENGLIEKVRTNIFPTGSAITTAIWDNVGATLTTGQTDPNGGTGAMRVQLASGSTTYIAQVFANTSVSFTRSVFIKAATAQTIRLVEPNTGGNVLINLTTSYQRFTLSVNGSGSSFGIRFDNENDSAAKDFNIAFIQLETGDIATPYIPTTTAAVSVGMLANVPRLDYTGGGCPKLLLEPQRTNLVFFSEQFNNAYWNKGGGTDITANAAIAPDGTLSADRVEFTGLSWVLRGFSSDNYAGSIFIKGTAGETIRFGMGNNVSQGALFTLTGDWQRLTHTDISKINLFVSNFGGATATDFHIWGAQLELGSYATSYIPTLAAAVTRSADAASKTGISALIGQTEGTLFVEATLSNVVDTSNIRGILEINDGTTNNRFSVFRGANDLFVNILVFSSAAATASFTTSAITGQIKIAIGYDSSNITVFINGSLLGTDNLVTIPACSELDLGIITNNTSRILGDGISQALLFKTRLSNAALAELTA